MNIFTLMGTVLVDNEKANESISKTGEKADSLASKVGKGIKTIAGIGVAVGGAVAAGGVAVGKMAMDFEQSFAKVTTLLDSNTTDFDKYKKEIMNASKESGISVDEFSEAVYGSISAGQDAGDAIAFTAEAMKLAKGGFTDGAKAVDVMTTALNGYKMDASEATKVSDLLITTQNLGKTTVDELASSMGKVIPIASASSFSIEELSATYATLTKNGIATAEAGTYTKAMLGELSKAGSKTDIVLKELTGQGFSQLKEAGVSTTDILQMLSDNAESSGMSLKDMFGSSEAGTAALVLMSESGAEYNEILNQMASSAGATDEAVSKMSSTVKDKFNKVLNAAKVSAIELGEKLLPMFDALLTWVLDNMPQIQAMIEKSFEVIGEVVNGAVAIIQWLIDAFGELFENSNITSECLIETWNNVKEMFSVFFKDVEELLSAFVSFCIEAWDKYGEDIMNIIEPLWDLIKDTFQEGFDIVKGIIDFFTAMFAGDFEGMKQAITNIIDAMWTWIKNSFNNSIDFIKNLVPLMVQTGKDLFNGLWDGFKAIWSGISSWVSDKVSWLADKLMFWRKSEDEMSETKGTRVDGSHKNGLSYVPFDGYTATLHKAEAVLTEDENKEWQSYKRGGTKNSSVTVDTSKMERLLQELVSLINNLPRNFQNEDRLVRG